MADLISYALVKKFMFVMKTDLISDALRNKGHFRKSILLFGI